MADGSELSGTPDPGLRASDGDRDRAAERLRTAFAEGRLDDAEFDQRLRGALAAKTLGELAGLVADLPPAPRAAGGLARPGEAGGPAAWVVAVLSGNARRGDWRVPARVNVVALMGGATIDLRAATLGASTTITAVAVMGGIEVIVPPDVEVESSGFGLLGGWGRGRRDAPPPGAPLVRVRGVALMGGVDIKTRRRRDG